MRPDDVSDQFPEGSIRITTRIVHPDSGEEGVPTIIIEGDEVALEYLGKLFLAQAKFALDCGFGISPAGPGQAFFDGKSQVGIYIHRIPCIGSTANHLQN